MSFPEDEATLSGSRRNSVPADEEKMIDYEQYTFPKRLWRPHPTSFTAILNHPYPGKGTIEEPYLISFIDNDAENGQRFSKQKKWTLTMLVAVVTLAVALSSSAYSGAIISLREDFPGASQEVLILGISLFVLGFALGPLIWGPCSEVFGRRNTFLVSYTFFVLWSAVTCASQSIAQIVVFRFLAGAFGSSPLTNAGGTIADLFSAKERGLAMALFACAPFLGPVLGPISGGFLGSAGGWKWVEAMLALFAFLLLVLGFLFLPETYAPTILRSRARLLSKVTGKYYRANMDAKQELVVADLIKTSLVRPWILLFSEPIVLILSIYVAIVYGILYLLFSAYPQVYQYSRGWSPGIGGLAFVPVAIGILIGVAYVIVYDNPRYIRVMKANNGKAPPESRLPPAMIGSVSLVIGLAWFAAACGPSTHWIVPILSGAPFGLGMVLVFLALQNYLVDSYTIYAASVLAANSLLRSLFGAAFPLFTTQMYDRLGLQWASAIPAFLAFACLPFPYLFYRYGAKVRMNCKYAKSAAEALERMTAASSEGKEKGKSEST